jgi:hypothetical protein
VSIGPYSDPVTFNTIVGSTFTPPFSDPVTFNTLDGVGVGVPLPPFSDPVTFNTFSTTEWRLSVTGSTVGASLSAS